jgi:hypothetical protein
MTRTTLVRKCPRPGCGGDAVFRSPGDAASDPNRCARCRGWLVLDVRPRAASTRPPADREARTA